MSINPRRWIPVNFREVKDRQQQLIGREFFYRPSKSEPKVKVRLEAIEGEILVFRILDGDIAGNELRIDGVAEAKKLTLI